MVKGERFIKDGKLVEVTSVETWGYGFRIVTDKEFPKTENVPVFEKTEPEEEPPVVVEKEVKKPITRRKRKA